MKKSISTEMTPENISRVIALLDNTPQRLIALSKDILPQTQVEPLKSGERSFIEIVAHIINCDERTTESIYAALLINEPLLLDIHPERQWGQLLRYEQFEGAELLNYFGFRRRVLLRILKNLTEAEWARTIREEGKQRKESVYWRARVQALHESEHLVQIETRFGTIDPQT